MLKRSCLRQAAIAADSLGAVAIDDRASFAAISSSLLAIDRSKVPSARRRSGCSFQCAA
jgi:hypothetical protein